MERRESEPINTARVIPLGRRANPIDLELAGKRRDGAEDGIEPGPDTDPHSSHKSQDRLAEQDEGPVYDDEREA